MDHAKLVVEITTRDSAGDVTMFAASFPTSELQTALLCHDTANQRYRDRVERSKLAFQDGSGREIVIKTNMDFARNENDKGRPKIEIVGPGMFPGM